MRLKYHQTTILCFHRKYYNVWITNIFDKLN